MKMGTIERRFPARLAILLIGAVPVVTVTVACGQTRTITKTVTKSTPAGELTSVFLNKAQADRLRADLRDAEQTFSDAGGEVTYVFVSQSARGAVVAKIVYRCNPEVPGSVSVRIAADGSEKQLGVEPPSC
jgi:hypothetical protein